MEWSLSKVVRIESGDVSISINDLRNLLGLLGVRDKGQVEILLADARTARTRTLSKARWWQNPPFREYLSDQLRGFIEYEAEASEVCSFANLYLPGSLQTSDYAAALTGMWLDSDMPQGKIDALVEARRRRHEALLSRLGAVKFLLVADESVLRRPVGGPVLFARQLRHLIALSEQGLIKIRMLPHHLPVPVANNGSFDLLRVDSAHADGEVLYRENGLADELIDNRAEIARHRRRFNHLWQSATGEDDTMAFIGGRVAELTSPGAGQGAN